MHDRKTDFTVPTVPKKLNADGSMTPGMGVDAPFNVNHCARCAHASLHIEFHDRASGRDPQSNPDRGMKRSQERSHGRPRPRSSRQEQLPRESVSASCNRRYFKSKDGGKEPRTRDSRRPRLRLSSENLFLKTRLSDLSISRAAMGAPAMAPAAALSAVRSRVTYHQTCCTRDSRVERRMQSHRVLCTRTTRLRQHP